MDSKVGLLGIEDGVEVDSKVRFFEYCGDWAEFRKKSIR